MKTIKLWLTAIATLLCSITASAYDFEVDGIYYNIISASDLTVEVTSGDNYGYYSGDVIIPSTVNYSGKAMTVTGIGSNAFFSCSELTGITIPNTVTSIDHPFSYCDGLVNIVIESGNTVYDSRDNCNAIIETNSNTLIAGSKKTNIPNSVTSIGEYAFYGCRGLTNITIPNSVTSIGRSAFNQCSGLTNITIPNNVKSIGEYAFEYCTELTSATIPNSVTSIGERAFSGCSGLTSITIPNSVECIGRGAFLDTGWWNKQQDGLIYIDGWLIGYKGSRPIFDIAIQDGTKRIANYALAGCSGITNVTIPNSVTSIGEYAFFHCSGLVSVTIPNSVTSIGRSAFENCSGLISVTIPNSITNLDGTIFGLCDAIEKLELNCPTIESWFSGKQSIKEVIIGNSVTNIGGNAFRHCSGLTSVTIGNSVTSIGREAFSYCSELTDITIPNSVTNIGAWAFLDCLELTNISIPNSVTNIGEYAFSGSGLTNITIGNSVTNIENGAFFRCDAIEKLELNCPTIESWFSGKQSIKEVIIGNSVISIGENSFFNCSGLTSVTIGNSVTSIGNSAFRSCSGLTSITIPNSVTSVGEYAFYGCSGLTSVTIPNSVMNIGYRAFDNCNVIEKLELNCPTIESWFSGKQSIKEVIIGNSVISIGDNAFSNFEGLIKIEIPNSVTEIGENAFLNCLGLTSITIPNSVASIGEDAFEGTSWYNNQPDGIVYAGKVLYKYKGTMPESTDITIEDGTLGIAGGAFRYCYGLTSITIPNSMSNIGEYAFSYCYALKKINSFIPAENLFVPDDNAFYGVNKETCTLYVPEDDVSAYESTAGWNEFEQIVEFNPYYTITYRVDGEIYVTETIEYGSEIILIDEPVREGYTFSGWSEVPETMPANDVTIEGSFTVNKYLVTFKIGDEVIAADSLEYGAPIVAPEVSEREGYSFDGWSDIPETMLAEDIAIIGTFIINKYLVTFKIGDEVITADSLEYGAAIVVPVAPEKEGHTFDGWGEVAETVPTSDVIYEGCYSVNSYKLTYIVDDEIIKETMVAYGDVIEPLEEPAKEGYTFSGWSEAPETMPANDLTISGTFTINKYLVTFKIGETIVAADSLEYGSTIVAPEVPEKEGYTFDGWKDVSETMPAADLIIEGKYTAKEYLLAFIIDGALYEMRKVRCDEKIAELEIIEKEGHTFAWENWMDRMPAKDYTIRGKYMPNNYAVIYMVDDKVVRTDSVTYGTILVLCEESVKEGYTFSGWSEAPETMPAEDVTISGTFTVNKYLVTFKIGDEVIAADSLEYGAAIVAPEAPEKEGYTFDGWGEVAETVPANDLTYEGSYSVNSYLLTYTVDGETVQSDSVAYGTAITLLDEPTKDGYTFSGWSEAPETMPAEDVTISGTFTVNKYLVTFKIDEEVIAADSLEYGAAIIAPEAPEKDGYTFNGWGEVAETVPANDVTYEGSYSVNSYLLTYTVDGETVQSDSVAYGTAITLLDEPVKEGYTFSGWSEAPETMPAEDVTISGTFAISKYLVTFTIGEEVIAADSLEYGAAIVAPEAPEKDGYTFNGWDEVAETVPAGDVTYEGTYTINIYKVYYYVGEELVYTAEVAYGESILEYIYEPTGEGDVFEGWVGDTYETMPAHDVTYVANITNGIDAMSTVNGQQTTGIYDLMGRKVTDTENLKGGVYIVNGRKVVIK